MKLKTISLDAFEVFPGENGKVYYHDNENDFLDNAQGYVSNELSSNSNELISHSGRHWLAIVSYPDQEWVDTGRMIPRESGIISDPERVLELGKECRFEIPLVFEICERCRGKGTVGNPAFNGTSTEWWQESGGPDWREDLDEYVHGDMYDVQCENNCDNGKAFGIDWTWLVERVKYAFKMHNENHPIHSSEYVESLNEYAAKIRQNIEDYEEYLAERRSEERWGW